MSYKVEAVKQLAQEIKAAGFRVFIAESGTYGFYTDSNGCKVVSFQYGLGGFVFCGNYTSDNPRQTGTGWQLAESDFQNMLGQGPAFSYVRNCNWHYTTMEEKLKVYQASSKFSEVE